MVGQNRWKRKGQMQQVYIIIFALFVIAASIYLGIKLFGGLKGSACEANNAAFMRDVRDALDENAPMGSRNDVKLSSPCNALALCFVDVGALGNGAFNDTNDVTIDNAARSGVKTTIYLKAKDSTVPVGYDERVIVQRSPGTPVPTHALCINATSGQFIFRTRGYGRYISIERP